MWYLYKLPQPQSRDASILKIKLDLAFNNVKPKDWYFVLD